MSFIICIVNYLWSHIVDYFTEFYCWPQDGISRYVFSIDLKIGKQRQLLFLTYLPRFILLYILIEIKPFGLEFENLRCLFTDFASLILFGRIWSKNKMAIFILFKNVTTFYNNIFWYVQPLRSFFLQKDTHSLRRKHGQTALLK